MADSGKAFQEDVALKKPADTSTPKQSKPKLILVLISILLAMFLICLDRTIISTVRSPPALCVVLLHRLLQNLKQANLDL